jgi:DNA polymerase III epsilon subunit-like protein
MGRSRSFFVVDSEGSSILREICIINHRGEVVYEALVDEALADRAQGLTVFPLKQVLESFWRITHGHLVIFHYADHDCRILRNSCLQVGIPWQSINTQCTIELAKDKYPRLSSYSLEFLSKKFFLKVEGKYFNQEWAHRARYDALFTYQLYNFLQDCNDFSKSINVGINPFSSSRVDTPFQEHVDARAIYQQQFEQLKAIIQEVRQDKNRQSKGVVVTGIPGSGKTHLMMRLTKEILQINRVLFIRHPNNQESIIYHIYSRILESFIYQILGTGHSQLEFLLAHSFTKLISQMKSIRLTQKDQYIVDIVKQNPLELYHLLGSEGTDKKRDYWDHIEKRASEWWTEQYGIGGNSPEIIKGIIKFCRYTEPYRQQTTARWLAGQELSEEDLKLLNLNNWHENLGKEGFSLEAISVFSKLSLLDEPLVMVFDQLEVLGLPQNQSLLIGFGEALKEIFTHVPNCLVILNLFPDRWQYFQSQWDSSVVERVGQYHINLDHPNDQLMRQVLTIKADSVGVKLTDIFTEQEIASLLRSPSIRHLINNASKLYSAKANGSVISHQNFDLGNKNLDFEQRLNLLENSLSDLQAKIYDIGLSLTNFFSSQNQNITKALIGNSVGKTNQNNETGLDFDFNFFITGSQSQQSVETQVKDLFRQNREILQDDYQKLQIITESDDIGKLKIILEAIVSMHSFKTDFLSLGRKRLPEHILIRTAKASTVIAFLHRDGGQFTSYIKNFNQLVSLEKRHKFYLWRDQRQKAITGKVGREEIEKLNNSANGQFQLMEEQEQVEFELLYLLITAIYNQDIELEIGQAWPIACGELRHNWLVQLLDHC